MNFKNAAEAAASYIIEQRRWFHQHPELSWEEYHTTDKIAEELTAMGYEVQRFEGKTGCCALLRGGKAAEDCKTVALRADIDALPVEEKTCLPFASENSGVMHACGHDGHISMLLGAASILMNLQTFVSRNNNPLNPLVVTVGEMHAGKRFNIIANHAEMYGTVRTFDPKFRLEIEANLRRIVENTAAALGLTASISYEYFCSPIINDDDQLTEIARNAASACTARRPCVTCP